MADRAIGAHGLGETGGVHVLQRAPPELVLGGEEDLDDAVQQDSVDHPDVRPLDAPPAEGRLAPGPRVYAHLYTGKDSLSSLRTPQSRCRNHPLQRSFRDLHPIVELFFYRCICWRWLHQDLAHDDAHAPQVKVLGQRLSNGIRREVDACAAREISEPSVGLEEGRFVEGTDILLDGHLQAGVREALGDLLGLDPRLLTSNRRAFSASEVLPQILGHLLLVGPTALLPRPDLALRGDRGDNKRPQVPIVQVREGHA
mmetsp:Transcript_14072/g.39238  ORF Transcript_14072/g.39238 Transcript_14072/m.39238 type:complete len:256 (-) Transcript_14072:207-974(-)